MEKTDLQGVPETMLQTLYARAKESQKEPHYIYDEKAIEIVSRLDYDFSKANKDAAMSTGVIARTILLDKMVEEFLNSHPGAVVINLACGLDTRCCRMNGKFSRWYNLDLPETIAVRKKFIPENGPVFQISSSADDPGWAGLVQRTEEPVLVIIEGLTMYLSEHQVQQIFSIIGNNFPGAQVFAEIMNPWIAKHMKEKSIEGSQAKFTWGVSDGKELEKLLPDFQNIRDLSLTEGMKVFLPIYKILGKIRLIRNISNKITVMIHCNSNKNQR